MPQTFRRTTISVLPVLATNSPYRRVRFERLPDSSRIFANINTSALEYAAAISSDGLELFFTRMTGALFWRKLTIEHAVRPSAAKRTKI
jgi:hypothetical protein